MGYVAETTKSWTEYILRCYRWVLCMLAFVIVHSGSGAESKITHTH